MVVWSLGAVVAAGVFGIWQTPHHPGPPEAAALVAVPLGPHPLAHRRVGRAQRGAMPLTLFAIGGIAGLAAAGAVRAGQVLMNAINVVTTGDAAHLRARRRPSGSASHRRR